MKKYSTRRGFTLIELLVVIGIIGVLAGIVLLAVNTARSKGKDVRILASVRQVKTQFESNYLGGTFVDLTTGPDHAAAINAGGPGFNDLRILINDIGAQNGNAAITAGGAGDIFSDGNALYLGPGTGGSSSMGIVILTTATGGGAAGDYAIYATTTAGYACADSYGHTLTNGVTTLPIDPANPPLSDGNVVCQ